MFAGIWPVARMFPPLDPALSAAAVADYYRAHQAGVLVGGILFAMLAAIKRGALAGT